MEREGQARAGLAVSARSCLRARPGPPSERGTRSRSTSIQAHSGIISIRLLHRVQTASTVHVVTTSASATTMPELPPGTSAAWTLPDEPDIDALALLVDSHAHPTDFKGFSSNQDGYRDAAGSLHLHRVRLCIFAPSSANPPCVWPQRNDAHHPTRCRKGTWLMTCRECCSYAP